MRLPGMLAPLRIREFALLWTGMTVSIVGDFFFFVAMAWQTYQLSNHTSSLGWISACYTLPLVGSLLLGGVLTDRFERRKMMIAGDLVRMGALGTAGALSVTGSLRLWEFGVLVALTGFGDALFAPAFGSIIPELVPTELLPQANALEWFIRPLAGLIGPALGGVIIATAGAGTALLADAGTFAMSTVAALMLSPRPLERRETRSALREIREGFAFVRAHAWLWGTLTAAGLMNVASASRNVLLPFVIKNDIHGSAKALGLVYSAHSLAALIGAFFFGQRGLPRRYVLVMYLGWAGGLFAIGAYGLASSVPQLAVIGFAGGLGFAYGQGIWGTMMHRLVPREVLGRVTSLDWMTSISLMPVASIAVGFIAASVGPRATLVGAGLLSGGVTVLFLVTIPGLRRPERESPGQSAEP